MAMTVFSYNNALRVHDDVGLLKDTIMNRSDHNVPTHAIIVSYPFCHHVKCKCKCVCSH